MLYLQQKFWLKNNGKFYGSQNFNSPNVSFAFLYMLWDKYHHAPIRFMVVLLSTYKPFIGLPFLNVSVIILYIRRSHVLRQILDENAGLCIFPPSG